MPETISNKGNTEKSMLIPILEEITKEWRKGVHTFRPQKDKAEDWVDAFLIRTEFKSETKDLEEARKVAAQIENPLERTKRFASIAKLSHQASDLEEARRAADDDANTRPYGYHVPRDWGARSYVVIAGVSHEPKDIDNARKAADKIRLPRSFRDRDAIPLTMRYLVKEDYRDERDVNQARKKTPILRAKVYTAIARLSKDQLDLEKARNAAADIDADLVKVKRGNYISEDVWNEKPKALIAIAEFSREEKDIDKARKAATVIADHFERAKAFCSIACVSHDPRDFEEAIRIPIQTNGEAKESEKSAIIAQGLIEAGRINEARTFLEVAKKYYASFDPIMKSYSDGLSHGYMDENGPPSSRPFYEIAQAYMKIGQISHDPADFQEAVKAAKYSPWPTLLNIARVFKEIIERD